MRSPPQAESSSIGSSSPVNRSFRRADRTLERELGAAFGHHPKTTAEPGLVIVVWDSESSGAPPPRISIDAFDGGITADTRVDGDQTIECRYDGDRRILNVYDRDTATGGFCVADPDDLPHWERSSPFRQILALVLSRPRPAPLHGAAVGERGIRRAPRRPRRFGQELERARVPGSPIPKSRRRRRRLLRRRRGADAVAWSLYRSAKVGWPQRDGSPACRWRREHRRRPRTRRRC